MTSLIPPLPTSAAVATYTLTTSTAGNGQIEASPPGPTYAPGTSVTLTARPTAGTILIGWTIDGAARGWVASQTIVMDGDHTARATFAARPSFGDVPAGSASYDAVTQLAARGIIKGYSADQCAALKIASPCFGPGDPVVRAQTAALIVRAFGWDTSAPNGPAPFSDLGGIDAELQRAIAILAQRGIINGYGDGTFGPTDGVLHIQVISFVARAMEKAGYWQAVTQDNPSIYPNVPTSSGHRADLLTFVKYAGPIVDRPQGQAWGDWNSAASRGWTAGILWQALDSYFGRPGSGPSPTPAPSGSPSPTPSVTPTPSNVPVRIDKVSADGGAAIVGTTQRLQVRITGSLGRPVAGYAVNWAVTGGGGSVTAPTSTSDANGLAAIDWVLGTTVGPQGATATAVGLTNSPITFNFTTLPGTASRLVLLTQPATTAQNGAQLARQPAVQLQDAFGNPVAQAGVAIAAMLGAGGGTLGGTTTVNTNGSGVAAFTDLAITGTVGDKTLTFSAAGYAGVTSNPIALTPGPATKLGLTTQPAATAQAGGALAPQPVVQLQDASGNAVALGGVAVSVTLASGDPTLGGTTTIATGPSGAASFTDLTITGTVGARTLAFAASGYAGVTSNTITVTAGSATKLSILTQPSTEAQSGAVFVQQPVVQLRDASDNVVAQAGVVVTATIASGGGTLGGTSTITTDATGTATFTDLTISGTVGSRTVAFSAAALTPVISTAITITAGPAARLVLTTQPPATAQAGVSFARAPVIQLQDASGNAVAQGGVAVTAAIASGGGTLGGTATVDTLADGSATFGGLSIVGTVGAHTLSFGASGYVGVTSDPIALQAGAATQLTITTQPAAAVQNGTTIDPAPVVQLRDASGNAVAQGVVAVTAAIASGDPALGGTLTVNTDGTGAATFADLTITGATGDRTLRFTGAGLAPVTSNAINVGVGAPSKLGIVTEPSAVAQSGVAFVRQPTVQLQDASGNPIATSGVPVTVAIATGGGTLGGTTTVPTVNGVATFTDLAITGTAGDRTLVFNATDGTVVYTQATSTTITVGAGAAAGLAFTVQPATVVAGAAIAPAVQVTIRDSAGNTVTTATDTITLSLGTNPSGATLGGTPSVAAVNGVATFGNLTLDKAGTGYTLVATDGALSATSAGFNVTAGALDHFRVERAGGGNIGDQTVNVPFNVMVTAQDANDNTATSFTGTVSFTSTPTGGIAAGTTSAAFTNGVLNSQGVTFTAGGTFTLTATSGAASGTSNPFLVQSPPAAVADGPAANSAPGDPYHAPLNATNYTIAATPGGGGYTSGLLANDTLGGPAGTIATFGGGSLGGAASDHPVGTPVAAASAALTVNADGSVAFTPATNFTGNFTFQYVLANAAGTSTATVTIAVGARPAATNATYAGGNLIRNVTLDTTGTGTKVAFGGDGVTFAIVGTPVGGTASINADGTYAFFPSPAAAAGAASFQYSVTNGFGSQTATVSFTLDAKRIWFVDKAAPAGGNGTQARPWQDLNSATTTTTVDNDIIFVAQNATPYTSGIALRTGQRLIGQDTSQAFATVAGVTAAANQTLPTAQGVDATKTLIQPGTGTAITLGSGDTVAGLTVGNATTAIAGSGFGTLTTADVTIATNGQALDLATGTLSGNFAGITSSGGARNISLNGVTAGGSSGNLGGGALSGAATEAIAITSGGGTFAYAGTVANSGRGIALNTGATVNFTGMLTLNTGVNTAFSASGGGTVTANATGSTLTTTTGTALSVTNTNIGAAGLTFQSISANGGANGIYLSNTGTAAANGGLTVTGNSAGQCGGSANVAGAPIGPVAADCTGGTIQATVGADTTTAGIGVYLQNTKAVSLTRLKINDNQNFAIRGIGVAGLTLNSLYVTGANGNSSAAGEGSVILDELTGTSAISSSTIEGGIEDNIRVQNSTGTLGGLTVSDSIVRNNSSASGNNGFTALALATGPANASMTITLTGNRFQGNRAQAIRGDAAAGQLAFTASQNIIGVGNPNQGNQGIEMTAGNSAQLSTTLGTNTISGLASTGINVFASGTSTITAVVTNNNVTNAGAGFSGFGIRLFLNQNAVVRGNIRGNTVSNVGLDYGILVESSGASATTGGQGVMAVAVENNTANVLSGALDAIRVQARNANTVCARITGNRSASAGGGFYGLYARQADTATFQLEVPPTGPSLGTLSAGGAQGTLATQNPLVTSGVGAYAATNFAAVASGSCMGIPSAAFDTVVAATNATGPSSLHWAIGPVNARRREEAIA